MITCYLLDNSTSGFEKEAVGHVDSMCKKPVRPGSMETARLTGTLISCVHGRDRRKQRNIERFDLLAAVQYGKKESAHSDRKTGEPRWKYTFANVVYITDSTSRYEITSYVLPVEIDEISLSVNDTLQHWELCKQISLNPSLCTSHTVLIVDHSGSMRTNDVSDYKTRLDAVYTTLALDIIGTKKFLFLFLIRLLTCYL